MSLYDKVKEDAEWKPLSDGNGRLYVIVRGDLTKSQQAVQAAHAVAQFCLTRNYEIVPGRHPLTVWSNEFLILLKARDLTDLCIWREKIRAKGFKWVEFKEPDLDNQTTAVAAFGDGLNDFLRDLSLV